MKTNKLIAVVLLAALATGCSKDDSVAEPNAKNVIKIHASAMGGNGGTKLSLDPGANGGYPNYFDIQWVDGELIKFKGASTDIILPIISSGPDCYIDHEPFTESVRSLYPGESFDGNEVDVNADGIVMHSMHIKFMDVDRQTMAFPMVAVADANEDDFTYNYLCGGVRLTLDNQSGADMNVKSLRIVAQSITDVVNLGTDESGFNDGSDIVARWATEGPWVPFNTVGDNEDEVDVKYSSVMNFTLSDDDEGTDHKILYNDHQVQFCVPITISSMKKLNITGYDEEGRQLFQVHKDFANDVQVVRGKMYDLPVIEIK